MAVPRELADHFGWLDGLLAREIRRLRARYQLSLDEFRGLYVSDGQVDEWIAAQRPPDEPAGLDPVAPSFDHPDGTWRALAERSGLGVVDEHVLLLACACALDLRYEAVFAYLNNDVTRKWPTADIAERVLGELHGAQGVMDALSPQSPLVRDRLVERIAPPTGHPAFRNSGFVVSVPVVQFLQDGIVCDPALADVVETTLPTVGWDDLPMTALRRQRLERLARLFAERSDARRALLLRGDGIAAAEALASALALPMSLLDLARAALDESRAADTLARLSLQLRLRPSLLCITGFPAHPGARPIDLSPGLASVLAPIVICAEHGDDWRPWLRHRRVIEVGSGADGFAQAVAAWTALLGKGGIALPDHDVRALAGRFTLSARQIEDAIATARDMSRLSERDDGAGMDASALAAAVRMGADQSLERLATKIESRHVRSDLVLPPSTMQRLDEVTAAIRNRHVVYEEWGFAQRVSAGTGVKALFAGPSGTGKTMAAGIIAKDLGLDVYRIDLSAIVSKYIGETEKNLDRIFRAARASNAIVFLDEAEAIMGKRSEVKDAHDRYANIEVAYLLQKLEEHEGIVILASNLRRNIDDAFNRRMHYVVDFPPPDEEQRARLWRGMFPPRAPLATDIDFEFLARHFDLAGGDIRNVALDAAFLAAQSGHAIDMRCVVEALARQLAKQGKTPTAADFRQYQRLVGAEASRLHAVTT